MTDMQIVCPIRVAHFDELTPGQQALVTAARSATGRSYAPYSNFHVGAALLLESGEIVTGANQENAATPSSMCAERSAVYYAGAQHPGDPLRAIAIAACDESGNEVTQPISPCGACRQALLEYEKLAGAPVEVMLAGKNEIYIIPSVRSLVPLAFTEV